MADSYFFDECFLDPSILPIGQFEMDDPTVRTIKRRKKQQPRQRKKKINTSHLSDEDNDREFSDGSSDGEKYYDSSSESEESESEDEEAEASHTIDLMSNSIPDNVSEYEMTRLKKIQENQQMLQNLGIKHLAVAAFPDADVKDKKKKKHKEDYEDAVDYSNLEKRESKRLRGIQPESVQELIEKYKREKELEEANRPKKPLQIEELETGSYSSSLWYGRPRKWFANNAKNRTLPEEIYVPLTLGSIGTTIEAVGSLKTGPDERFYWSNRGCLHRHPYPIGWTATKEYFGRIWTMKIKEGPKGKGPIFEVSDGMGHTYTGRTPTQPWTHVCVNSTSKGTRVSGPLFFGFSDPISMKLIQKLSRGQNPQTANDTVTTQSSETNNNNNNISNSDSNSNATNNDNNGNNSNSLTAETESLPLVKKPCGRKSKNDSESSPKESSVRSKAPLPTRTTRSKKSSANINNTPSETSKETPALEPTTTNSVKTEVPKAEVVEESKTMVVERTPEMQEPAKQPTESSPTKGKKRENQDSEKDLTPQKKAKTNSKNSPVTSPNGKGFRDLRDHFQKLYNVNNEKIDQ